MAKWWGILVNSGGMLNSKIFRATSTLRLQSQFSSRFKLHSDLLTLPDISDYILHQMAILSKHFDSDNCWQKAACDLPMWLDCEAYDKCLLLLSKILQHQIKDQSYAYSANVYQIYSTRLKCFYIYRVCGLSSQTTYWSCLQWRPLKLWFLIHSPSDSDL